MSYKMPLKHTGTKSKWMTIALVMVYVLIGLFIAVNN